MWLDGRDLPASVTLISLATALERCAARLHGAAMTAPGGGVCFADAQTMTVSAQLAAYGVEATALDGGSAERACVPAVVSSHLGITCVLKAVSL